MKLLRSQFDLYQRVVDALVVGGSLPIAFWIYYGNFLWSDKYTITAIAAIPIFYLSARICSLYRSNFVQGGEQQIQSLFLTWSLTLTGLLVMGYAFKSTHELSRVTLGIYALIVPVLLIANRLLSMRLLAGMRARGYGVRSAIIVGTDSNAKALARSIASSPWMGLELKGFVALDGADATDIDLHAPLLGHVSDLKNLACEDEVDLVYVSAPMAEQDKLDAILRVLGDSTLSIFLVPDIYTADVMQGTWVTIGNVPAVCVIDEHSRGTSGLLKRVEDLCIASIFLILLAAPMLIIGLAVRLSSPGPALYKQFRYGASGKPILVWKFRTMTVMESTDEFVQATKGDARVTPLGKFLRRTSLDELPQLFNVLMGTMSIVGPRPHPVALNEAFRGKIFGYMLRHKVKPGITGLAQVNGYRGETDTQEKMEQRIRYDIEYINNWSIWLDLAIIIRTPISMLRSNNAY